MPASVPAAAQPPAAAAAAAAVRAASGAGAAPAVGCGPPPPLERQWGCTGRVGTTASGSAMQQSPGCHTAAGKRSAQHRACTTRWQAGGQRSAEWQAMGGSAAQHGPAHHVPAHRCAGSLCQQRCISSASAGEQPSGTLGRRPCWETCRMSCINGGAARSAGQAHAQNGSAQVRSGLPFAMPPGQHLARQVEQSKLSRAS